MAILRKLPKGYEHKIDFTKYHHKAVYDYALTAAASFVVSSIENPTFYDALKVFFEKIYKEDKHFELDSGLLNGLTIKQLDKISTLHPKIKEDKGFIGNYFNKQFNEELSEEN